MGKTKNKTYRVTGSVYVEACSARHAAHIGKGVFQMKGADGPFLFIVEERCVNLENPCSVDLSKVKGQKGYVEDVESERDGLRTSWRLPDDLSLMPTRSSEEEHPF